MGIRSAVFMSRLSLVKTKSMGNCVVVVFFLQLYCLHKLRVRVILFVKGFTCPARGNYTCFEVRNKSWSLLNTGLEFASILISQVIR